MKMDDFYKLANSPIHPPRNRRLILLMYLWGLPPATLAKPCYLHAFVVVASPTLRRFARFSFFSRNTIKTDGKQRFSPPDAFSSFSCFYLISSLSLGGPGGSPRLRGPSPVPPNTCVSWGGVTVACPTLRQNDHFYLFDLPEGSKTVCFVGQRDGP